MSNKIYAGFDLGGKNVRAVIADSDGKFISRIFSEEVDASCGPRQISQQMIELLERCSYSNVKLTDISAIGISSAGPLDLKKFRGSVKNSTNIKFEGVERGDSYWSYRGASLVEIENGKENIYIPLVEPIRNFLMRDVFLGNDVNTAIIGVVAFGEGRKYGDPDDLNYVGVATTHGAGFGTGVWARGGVFEGADGNAAECGHYKVVDDGRECGCGNFGCVETFGSGIGIARNAIAKLKEYGLDRVNKSEIYTRAFVNVSDSYENWVTVDPDMDKRIENAIDAKLVFDVYRRTKGQDRVAREVVEEAGKFIGRAYGMIACSYNPYFIATYGGVTKNWDVLEERVLAEMKRSCNVRIPDVFVTSLGNDVGLHGAIGRAMRYGR